MHIHPRYMFTRCALIVVCLIALAGCDGLKSCSSTAVSSGIIATNWTYSCNATFNELTEVQIVDIKFEDLGVYTDDVEASVTVTVETGSATLTVYDANYNPVMLTAIPEQPATYTGRARVNVSQGVQFEIAPIGDGAKNVHYEATFSG